MPIPVTCSCGTSLLAKDELFGQKIRCTNCGKMLAVLPPVREASAPSNNSTSNPPAPLPPAVSPPAPRSPAPLPYASPPSTSLPSTLPPPASAPPRPTMPAPAVPTQPALIQAELVQATLVPAKPLVQPLAAVPAAPQFPPLPASLVRAPYPSPSPQPIPPVGTAAPSAIPLSHSPAEPWTQSPDAPVGDGYSLSASPLPTRPLPVMPAPAVSMTERAKRSEAEDAERSSGSRSGFGTTNAGLIGGIAMIALGAAIFGIGVAMNASPRSIGKAAGGLVILGLISTVKSLIND